MQSQRLAQTIKVRLMNNQKPNQNATTARSQKTSVTRSSFRTTLVSSIKKLELWVLPGHCVLCRLATNANTDLCAYCENDLPWLFQQCTRCGLPINARSHPLSENFSVTDTKLFSGISNKNPREIENSALCSLCLTNSLEGKGKPQAHFQCIDRTCTPLSYSGCAKWMVQQQKHSKGGTYGRVLAELLSDALTKQAGLDAGISDARTWPDLLVPVPLHWRRQLSRGHNQSALLAKHLSKRLSLPVSDALVKRTAQTPSQQSLPKHARITNVAHAFQATKRAKSILAGLPNRRVAIIDDVVTTGSTANALARVLSEAGAEEIHLWSPTRAILAS